MTSGATSSRHAFSQTALLAMITALGALPSCGSLLGAADEPDEHTPADGGGTSSGGSGGSDSGGIGDSTVPNPDAGNDAGDRLDPRDADIVSPSEPDAAGVDATLGAAPCSPTNAFIPATGATGTVCGATNVLDGHTGSTGLDYAGSPQTFALVDGWSVSSCIAVAFAKPLELVVVRAASVGKACDYACGVYCGTGDEAHVFTGAAGVYKYLKTLSLTATAATFTLVPRGQAPTEVLVCRTGDGRDRDDVNVDAITGVCSP